MSVMQSLLLVRETVAALVSCLAKKAGLIFGAGNNSAPELGSVESCLMAPETGEVVVAKGCGG